MDHSEMIIYYSILTTAIYKADSSKVENLLRPLVMDTGAF